MALPVALLKSVFDCSDNSTIQIKSETGEEQVSHGAVVLVVASTAAPSRSRIIVCHEILYFARF